MVAFDHATDLASDLTLVLFAATFAADLSTTPTASCSPLPHPSFSLPPLLPTCTTPPPFLGHYPRRLRISQSPAPLGSTLDPTFWPSPSSPFLPFAAATILAPATLNAATLAATLAASIPSLARCPRCLHLSLFPRLHF